MLRAGQNEDDEIEMEVGSLVCFFRRQGEGGHKEGYHIT